MLLFRPIWIIFFTLILSCGFAPITKSGHDFSGQIEFANATNLEDYALRRALIRRFGEANAAKYALRLDYASSASTLAITQNNLATRRRLSATLKYSLTRLKDNQEMTKGSITRILGYTTTANRFAADQAKTESQIELASLIGEEIATRLIAALSQADANL